MATNREKTEMGTLEKYRVALDNVVAQSEIASEMETVGYDTTVIQQGQSLLAETRQAFDFNKTEADETSDSYKAFKKVRKKLETLYAKHRKMAKVVFRKEPETAKKLSITGSIPDAYIKWLEIVRTFYNVTNTDTEIQSKLARLKITAEELNIGSTKVTELETARSEYLREKGEDQNATKAKDAAFAKMDDWMSDFYAVARIALEDKPQLLESLGIFVRS